MNSENYTAYASENTDLFLEEPPVYAGFWERFAAAFLDGLIIMVPYYLALFLLGPFGYLVAIVLPWLYSALLESGDRQATFGKRAMGLKVTDVNGNRISFAQATGRHFGKLISSAILCIGYLMMVWDDKKQTLHDKLASTLIIKS